MTAPIAWLLDTNVVSEMMRRNPEPNVIGFLDRVAGDGIGLASVTVWEILNGIGLLDPGPRRDDLAERFHAILDELFVDRVLDWTPDDARTCARIMEGKRRRGEPLDAHLPDAFLAATARRRGLTILTRNVRDFRNTGVQVADPWAGSLPLRGGG